jgi:hypothetical protein
MSEADRQAVVTDGNGGSGLDSGEIVDCSAVNAALRELWREWLESTEWPSALLELWPVQYPNMLKRIPLFVGINPSYASRRDPFATLAGTSDLTLAEPNERLIEGWQRAIGIPDGKVYQYFAKFDDVVKGLIPGAAASNVGSSYRLNWNHIDVLAVRWAKQAELKGALGIDGLGRFQSRFVRRQLEIAVSLLDALEPVAVVVVNALASRILKTNVDHLRWDEPSGCYRRASVPWIFGGMLTGQRAMDNHSVERLAWHLRHACRSSRGGEARLTLPNSDVACVAKLG